MTDQEQNRLDHIETELSGVKTQLNGIEGKLTDILVEFKNFDVRIDTYQKAYQQVVNLAFGLIVAAVAAIVIPAVTGR